MFYGKPLKLSKLNCETCGTCLKNNVSANKYIFPVDENCLIALRVDSGLRVHFRIMTQAESLESTKEA